LHLKRANLGAVEFATRALVAAIGAVSRHPPGRPFNGVQFA
jgi:hypothetical protein